MPPNSFDPTITPDTVRIEEFKTSPINGNQFQNPNISDVSDEGSKSLAVFMSIISLFARILIGAIVGISYAYSLRNGLSLNATNLHIILCVTGFQLLMAEAILCLAEEGGWSRKLKLVEKRKAHSILQLLGSFLAVFGCFWKIVDKNVHWNTLHGQFGLVALVFTSVSLVNGVASLYAHQLQNILPGNISKITHVCFGTVAFVTASISLCYGFDKNGFRNFVQFTAVADAFISFTAIFTFIIIIMPLVTFYRKSRALVKKVL